jgi:hypothetical protein
MNFFKKIKLFFWMLRHFNNIKEVVAGVDASGMVYLKTETMHDVVKVRYIYYSHFIEDCEHGRKWK